MSRENRCGSFWNVPAQLYVPLETLGLLSEPSGRSTNICFTYKSNAYNDMKHNRPRLLFIKCSKLSKECELICSCPNQ